MHALLNSHFGFFVGCFTTKEISHGVLLFRFAEIYEKTAEWTIIEPPSIDKI